MELLEDSMQLFWQLARGAVVENVESTGQWCFSSFVCPIVLFKSDCRFRSVQTIQSSWMGRRRRGPTTQCNVEKDDGLTLAGLGNGDRIRRHVASQSEYGAG